jgi:hypothetical protein
MKLLFLAATVIWAYNEQNVTLPGKDFVRFVYLKVPLNRQFLQGEGGREVK